MTKPGTAPATDRPLSLVARHVIAPAGIKSTGWPRVRDTCHRLGWRFDAWQDGAGKLILSKRADGLYAADEVAISIPRQVGKTYLIACIIFALCLLHPRLTVIWTAHRKTTAAETFESFDGKAQEKLVAPHIRQVMRGKGDEKILFTNGSRILFGARESGFGRGFSDVDVLVFDEAQIMTEATLEDMAAAQNVAKNPLMFMMGTPPRPKDPGEVFTMHRQEALEGESEDTLYIELSADRGSDLLDREQWRKANPSYPHRTTERAMLRLRKRLKSDDSWRREGLGIWDEFSKHQPVVGKTAWSDLEDVGPAAGVKPNALAVDMSHGRHISVSACWLEGDHAHVEEVWAGTDEDAAVEWVAARASRRIPVVIDNVSPASSMAPKLRARKCKVNGTGPLDMARACGMFTSRVKARTLSHANQEAVNDALAAGRKRAIGAAGGWGWDRVDESAAIHPIVSLTLALFGAEATKRRRSGNGASFAGERGGWMAEHAPLDEEDLRRLISDMWRMHLEERLWLDRIYEYTKGLRGVPEVPENAGREVKDLAKLSVKNVLGGIRDTWTRNLSVVGYRRSTARENDPAWASWQRNRMDARQKEVHKPAVTYGAAYLRVLRPEGGSPVWTPRSPRQLLAMYQDPSLDEWPEYTLETWVDKSGAKPVRRGLLMDDVYMYPFGLGAIPTSDANASLPITPAEFDEPEEHGATYGGEPVCPVIRFVNDRDADDQIIGEIAALILDQQAINSVNFDRLLVSRFGAQPQKVITGWSGTTDEELKASARRVWTFEDPDVKAYTLSGAGVSGYTELIDSMKADIYEKAGLAPTKNGKLINLSAEALALAGKDENEKLADKRESFGESWEQALRLDAEMDGDTETAIDASAEVVWRDTEARSFAQVVDGVSKLAAEGVPIEMLLPMVPGMTQQQVRGIQDAMRRQEPAASGHAH